ncbi:hypothetical protein I302_103313 [Kwoniella bestiolae CBS 10118]|uniref:Uncharacterized protein n=1 Tax=Kwoniella bestiolae CBS 10118 TaxID=1296100 RepID=A0A1B9G829_9TREE|nr:hypothetical protein I302_02016 [Kwoniella bestiolae CBS 10118]OCF27178.1 hypothetical protein I302_02016 [Kwoniella bestiolae CBS 10118]
MPHSAGVVVLLNGYPGVGKSSVAKELLRILPNAKLLEYHSLRAVIDPLIDREKDTDRWMEMKKALLQTLLSNLASNPPTSSTHPPIYILTSHLCATPRRLSVLHSHLSSLPLLHVILNCSTEENLKRLKTASRAGLTEIDTNLHRNGNGSVGPGFGTKGYTGKKITDESTLYELRMEEELGRFYAYNSNGLKSTGGGGKSIEELKRKGLLGEYEVNTEKLEINQTAMLVSEYIIEACREMGWYIRLNPQKR